MKVQVDYSNRRIIMLVVRLVVILAELLNSRSRKAGLVMASSNPTVQKRVCGSRELQGHVQLGFEHLQGSSKYPWDSTYFYFCPINHSQKKKSVMFKWNFFYFHLCPLTLSGLWAQLRTAYCHLLQSPLQVFACTGKILTTYVRNTTISSAWTHSMSTARWHSTFM